MSGDRHCEACGTHLPPHRYTKDDAFYASCNDAAKAAHPKAELERLTRERDALLREVQALRRVRDQLRDDVSVGRIWLVDQCIELSAACAEADRERQA